MADELCVRRKRKRLRISRINSSKTSGSSRAGSGSTQGLVFGPPCWHRLWRDDRAPAVPGRLNDNLAGKHMRLHTFEDIAQTVTPSALDKATIYQRRRRAFVTEMAGDGTLIHGRVQGTQRRPYAVTVTLGVGVNGSVKIDGSCSCPVGFNCKHVAALLIESMAALNGQRLAAPSRPVLPPPAENWLAELDRAMALSEDQYPPSIRQRLIYVLSIADAASSPPRAVLELKSVRLLKDGSFSSNASNYDPQLAFSSTPARFLRGCDLPILRRLLHLRGLYGYGGRDHSLSGDAGSEILECVLATGRCHWGSLGGPVMARGEPRQGRIAWTLLDNGGQRPAVSIDVGGIAVGLVPPWYIDASAAVCGPLRIDLPPRVTAALMQAPEIDPRDVAALRGKLADRLGGHSDLLPVEPRPAEIIAGPPVPVLRLARRSVGSAIPEYSWRTPAPPPQDLQLAELTFAYDPFVLSAGDRRDQVLFARDGRLFAVERDRGLESQHRARLCADDTGLVPATSQQSYALPPDVRDGLILADDDAFAWPRFLFEVAPRLRNEGWRIEIERGFTPPLAEADEDIDAELHEGSCIDWFEFHVGISVDGQRVNLLPRIIELLRAAPEDADSDFFDLDGDDEKTLFVTLDDGRLLPLPYANVKPILTALHELFRPDLTVAREALAFNRSRAAELATLEALLADSGIVWSGGEALRLLGQKLREAGSFANALPRKALQRRSGRISNTYSTNTTETKPTYC